MSQTFMSAEILEAGAVVRRQLVANAAASLEVAEDLQARGPSFVATIARGSSDHAALYLKHLVELKVARACASLGPSIASLYHAPLRLSGAVAIAISQSGRSPDIVAMQRAAKDQGAATIAFVNDETSPLARGADLLLCLHAGPERSVAATKSMIASLVASASLVAHWSDDNALVAALAELPWLLTYRRPRRPSRRRSRRWPKPPPCSLSGAAPRTPSLPRLRSSSRKLRRFTREAFSSAEVLHGPAGVIGPGFPVLAFAPADAARSGFFETLDRLAAFGATPLVVDVKPHERWQTLIALDGGHPLLTPIVALHAFYRVAEAVARRRGRDPDQPPHLKKVTETL